MFIPAKHTLGYLARTACLVLNVLGLLLPLNAQGSEVPDPKDYQASQMAFTKTPLDPTSISLKEEIKKPIPAIQAKDFQATFSSQIISFFQSMTADESTQKGLASNSINTSEEDRTRQTYLNWSLLAPQSQGQQSPHTDAPGLVHLKNSSKTVLQRNLINKSTVLSSLQSPRFSFNLDFSSLASPTTQVTTKSAPNIRYGLVLKSIDPSEQKFLQAAYTASGHTTDEEMEAFTHAPRARTHWAVAPLTDDSSDANPYAVKIDNEISSVKNDRSFVGDLWNKITLPSPSFTGNLKPVKDNEQAVSNNTGTSKKLPPMVLSLTQKEELYQYNYITNESGKKNEVNHIFNAPISGTFGFSQKTNEKMKPVDTAANGLLFKPGLPSLNIHYLNQEHRFVGDLGYQTGLKKVAFKADTPKGWKPTDFTKSEKEKYTLEYTLGF